MKFLNWSLVVVFLLICSAIAQYKVSLDDGKKNDSIKNNTEDLIGTGNRTITNLEAISASAKIAQDEAKAAYDKVNETYTNSILNLEKSELNYQTTLENLKQTIEAQDKILKSQNEMISRLTGGDSYPHFTISNKKFVLHLEGDYGIPDLRIEIFFLKNYQIQEREIFLKYVYEGILNKDVIKFYDHTFPKLYVNKTYQDIIIPNEVLESIMSDDYSGFDIKFNSSYKSWTQYIRLHKNLINTNQIDIFNILYESKEIKAKYPEDLVKKLKTEASPNYKDFFNAFKKHYHLENFSLGYFVILYPQLDYVELEEKEVDQNLSSFVVQQFKPEKR